MSSQLRRFGQAPAHSPVRAKFFLNPTQIAAGQNIGDSTIRLDDPSVVSPSVITTAQFGSYFGNAAAAIIPQYSVLRDMGREVVIVNDAGVHLYKYRMVQLVAGAATEGVGVDNGIYVLVWSPTLPTNVLVVRTG
jgi:hypothetical protein